MSAQSTDTTPNPSEDQFFKALMTHIMEGTMIPKVQIERAIGPIIGFFLAEALSEHLGQDIITLCPEFPIRKTRLDSSDNNQSTNIDWLMFNRDSKELILLELKTTDTTFKQEQASIYKSLQETIAEKKSAAFLIDELKKIEASSQESGKYKNVLKILNKAFEELEGDARAQLDRCKRAQVIYLAPQASKPKDWPIADSDWKWLSFGDLPTKIEHEYASNWPAVHDSLVGIDELTRRIRNGSNIMTAAGKNYRHLCSFKEVLERCRTDGDSNVIGFMNWRKNLPSMDMTQLQSKTYKCDTSSDGVGKKIDRNWISGDEFLSFVDKLAM